MGKGSISKAIELTSLFFKLIFYFEIELTKTQNTDIKIIKKLIFKLIRGL